MFDIITLGSATWDQFLTDLDYMVVKNKNFITGKGLCFPKGSKLKVGKAMFSSGGGATNTAASFSRWGLKTAIVCRLGKDVLGRLVLEDLLEKNIDIQFLQFDYVTPTACSVIILDKEGDRTIFSYKGSNERLSAWEIPWASLSTNWLFLDSLGKDDSLLKTAVKFAQKNHLHLAINPGVYELALLKKHPQWLKYFEVFICNLEEAAYFTNLSYNQEKKIIQVFASMKPNILAITKGVKGSLVVYNNKVWENGVFSGKKMKDQTGAGDAFAAGFVSALIGVNQINDSVIEEAIRRGSYNAYQVIQHIGAKAGIITQKELEKIPKNKLIIKKSLLKL